MAGCVLVTGQNSGMKPRVEFRACVVSFDPGSCDSSDIPARLFLLLRNASR